jgi:lia operon protein LiaG
MKSLRTFSALFALLALATAAHAQRFELTGDRIAVYNLAGNLRIEAGTGRTAVVEVERSGRDASRLEVRTANINGVQTLVVIYPDDEVIAEGMHRGTQTTIRVNDDGTFNSGRSGGRRVRVTSGRGDRDGIHAQADIVLRLPQGTSVNANLAVGGITATGTAGDLELHTSAGDVSSSGNRGRVHAETASGDVTVNNAQGDLELESASGDIEVRGATSQRINAETASGSVTVSDATAREMELESASGNVRVSRSRTPRLKAESASGSVRAELDGEVESVQISTASGNAEVAVPGSFRGEVEMETASGDIDVGFEISIIRKQRNHLRGTIGGGGTGRISLETASGDVRLSRR